MAWISIAVPAYNEEVSIKSFEEKLKCQMKFLLAISNVDEYDAP